MSNIKEKGAACGAFLNFSRPGNGTFPRPAAAARRPLSPSARQSRALVYPREDHAGRGCSTGGAADLLAQRSERWASSDCGGRGFHPWRPGSSRWRGRVRPCWRRHSPVLWRRELDALADLAGRRHLLLNRLQDRVGDRVDALHRAGDGADRPEPPARRPAAPPRPAARYPRSPRGLAAQGLDFIGNDGKAPAHFPARAASMLAFNARRLVWSAICLIRSTTSPMARPLSASRPTMASVERDSSTAARAISAACSISRPIDRTTGHLFGRLRRRRKPSWRPGSRSRDASSTALAAMSTAPSRSLGQMRHPPGPHRRAGERRRPRSARTRPHLVQRLAALARHALLLLNSLARVLFRFLRQPHSEIRHRPGDGADLVAPLRACHVMPKSPFDRATSPSCKAFSGRRTPIASTKASARKAMPTGGRRARSRPSGRGSARRAWRWRKDR